MISNYVYFIYILHLYTVLLSHQVTNLLLRTNSIFQLLYLSGLWFWDNSFTAITRLFKLYITCHKIWALNVSQSQCVTAVTFERQQAKHCDFIIKALRKNEIAYVHTCFRIEIENSSTCTSTCTFWVHNVVYIPSTFNVILELGKNILIW